MERSSLTGRWKKRISNRKYTVVDAVAKDEDDDETMGDYIPR